MTPRERLQAVLAGKIPDCVPVSPDFSNMIPARLTGKPFWDLYLYNDPPIWEAYINCARHFNIDALMDGYFWYSPPDPDEKPYDGPPSETCIVQRSDDRIITQSCTIEGGRRKWAERVNVYYRADPPTSNVLPSKIDCPSVPAHWEPLEGVKPVDHGPEGLRRLKQMMGSQGLVGVFVTWSCVLNSEDAVYNYYDHPELHEKWAMEHLEAAEKKFKLVMAQDVKPDFICVGGSGTLVFQTVDIFRQLAFPAVKRVIELATEAGLPTHIHSCGPEKELVKIMAEETSLSVIDPLEVAPMGDCNLAELKRLYGNKITLKGNLHTTEVMLRGTVDDVIRASRKAIDDAAEGGRFILSTGDQCGRDTPDENLNAMIETARTYGKYS